MEPRSLSPRSRAKREQVRAAAHKLFLAHGVAGTSMDAITAEAGVAKQTVYAHFASKEALLLDMLETFVTRVARQWEEVTAAQPPPSSRAEVEQRLIELALRIIDTLMEPDYLATVRVVIGECSRNPELGDLFRQAVAAPVLGVVGTVLEQAAGSGVLRRSDPREAARLLVGPLLTFVLLDGLLSPQAPKRPERERVVSLVRLVMDGLGTA